MAFSWVRMPAAVSASKHRQLGDLEARPTVRGDTGFVERECGCSAPNCRSAELHQDTLIDIRMPPETGRVPIPQLRDGGAEHHKPRSTRSARKIRRRGMKRSGGMKLPSARRQRIQLLRRR